MRLVLHRDAVHAPGKCRTDFSTVRLVKLPRHPWSAYDEVGPDGLENLQNSGHIIDERNIHGLDAGPERKAAVGDHQRVRVPHAAEQRVDLWVQYSGLKHADSLVYSESTQFGAGSLGQPWRWRPLENQILDP